MHGGRQYRQVLPPIETPDQIAKAAPIFLKMTGGFFYGGLFLPIPEDTWEPAINHIDAGTIQWALSFVVGGFSFSAVMQQRIVNHSEGTFYSLNIFDNVADFVLTKWVRYFYQQGWQTTFAPPNIAFNPKEYAFSGLFGLTAGLRMRAVTYHEEP